MGANIILQNVSFVWLQKLTVVVHSLTEFADKL
jgi:hypothetical protein